jgi:hypothetical protein
LEQSEHPVSLEDGIYLHCKGVYSPKTLKTITDYIANQNLNKSTLLCKGKYEDFVGSSWLRETKEKYGWH